MNRSSRPSPESSGRHPLALSLVLLLLLITVGYRVAASHYPALGNTSPLMAVAFGGALLLGFRFWWVPVALLVASDLLLGFWHGTGGLGGYTVFSACFYLLVAFLGGRLGEGSHRWVTLWVGTLSCSILFYVLANTFSWLVWPGYAQTWGGWLQAQTTGLPGVQPPSWMFLRNALIADSIWCGIAGTVIAVETRLARREAAGATV